MMLRGVWIIFAKDLLDTVRDKKTLFFMLFLPTVALPLLMIGGSRLVLRILAQQAGEKVTIVADEHSRRAYETVAHEWFRGTTIAQALRVASLPFLKALVKPEYGAQLGEIPQNLNTDPRVFAEWCAGLGEKVRAGLDSVNQAHKGPMLELPKPLQKQAIEFYQVAIKGLGLVEFIDPAGVAVSGRHAPFAPAPELAALPHIESIAAAIRDKAVDGYLVIPADFDALEREDRKSLTITFVYDSTIVNSEEAHKRVEDALKAAGKTYLLKRLVKRDLGRDFMEPLKLRDDTDLATRSEIFLVLIGSILPYFVIAFAFLGGMYPAIDLGAGEKERFTLETLLLSPASRLEIAIGKFCVILATALTAALLGVIALAVSFQYMIPAQTLAELELEIRLSAVLLVSLLAVPPAMIFAGVFLAVSIYARSFKEAQSYMAPLQFLIVIPAMAGLLPGVEITWKTAAIPLVNLSLLSREFLKGNYYWGYYSVTFLSCLLLAALCILFAIRQFHREEVLFRT